MKKEKKIIWLFIYFICVLFIVFYLSIQYNNRINSQDDFILIKRLKDLGFWKSIITWKFNQRPIGHMLFNITFYFNEKVSSFKWSLLLSNLIFISLFTHSIKLIIDKILKKNNQNLKQIKKWSLSILIVMCTFFFVFERSEIWYWYICFLLYLLPLVFINYGLILILSNNKIKWFSLLLFFMIGGELEIYIFITFCILVLVYINKLISFKKLIINTISLLSLSIFQFFNKGIANRINLEKKAEIIDSSTFTSTFIHIIDHKNIFFVLLVIIITSVLSNKTQKINYPKVMMNLGLVLLQTFIITLSIGKIIFTNSWGPLRIWAPFSILLMLFIIILILYINNRTEIKLQFLGIISSFIFIILFTAFSFKQYYITSNYAEAYDNILDGDVEVIMEVDSGVLISPGHYNFLLEYLNTSKNE